MKLFGKIFFEKLDLIWPFLHLRIWPYFKLLMAKFGIFIFLGPCYYATRDQKGLCYQYPWLLLLLNLLKSPSTKLSMFSFPSLNVHEISLALFYQKPVNRIKYIVSQININTFN